LPFLSRPEHPRFYNSNFSCGSHNSTKKFLSKLQHISLYHQGKEAITDNPFAGRTIWSVFPRQQGAFELQVALHGRTCCFSFEDGDSLGVRQYLVTTYADFWRRYKNMDGGQRHFYEVIKEGCWCKLYFDLEFPLASNPQADGNKMLGFFKGFVLRELRKKHPAGHFEEDCIVELCSTSASKFSAHLVFHTPGVAFQSNFHAGHFVRATVNRLKLILQDRTHDDHIAARSLVVTREDGTKGFFIDEGVYSRNRVFRIYLSSKFGKGTCFQKGPGNSYSCQGGEEQFFLDSLVCHMDSEPATLLSYQPHEVPSAMITFSFETLLITPDDGRRSYGNYQGRDQSFQGTRCPYPQVDRFILKQVSRRGNTSFRSVVYFPATQRIVYQIAGSNRYCHNIGRHHKSNNVIYVADLGGGYFFQKCLDPDCRQLDYRSPAEPIPASINPIAQEATVPHAPASPDYDGLLNGMCSHIPNPWPSKTNTNK